MKPRVLLAALAAACASSTAGLKVYVQPEPGERHLRNIQQLSFSGNNAESYFSSDGRQIIFQRQEHVD